MCKLAPSTKRSDEVISNIESFNYSSIEDECLMCSFAGKQDANRYGSANREILRISAWVLQYRKKEKFQNPASLQRTRLKSSQCTINWICTMSFQTEPVSQEPLWHEFNFHGFNTYHVKNRKISSSDNQYLLWNYCFPFGKIWPILAELVAKVNSTLSANRLQKLTMRVYCEQTDFFLARIIESAACLETRRG